MTAIVYSTHPIHARAAAAIEAIAEFRIASRLDAETLADEGAEADIVVVRAPVPERLFGGAPRLRAAIRHGAGLDMIPLEAATAAGVLVANLPGINARSVAEYAVMAALMMARRIRSIDGALRQEGWAAARAQADATFEIGGRTLGVVGLGAVGQAVASIAAKGFGMRVLATSRRLGPPSGALQSLGVEVHDLDVLVAQSDILVLCVPLDASTLGLMDGRRLAAMKAGAILVNVARGAVVDEAALVAALAGGHLGGAVLDVFATQPLASDHALLQIPNVVLTPHLAGITADSMERMGMGVAAEIRRILDGENPLNLVNPDAEPAYRRRFG